MSSASVVIAAKMSETLENYAVSDVDHRDDALHAHSSSGGAPKENVYSESEFWKSVLKSPDEWSDRIVTLPMGAVVSEWVARVPGLYYKKGSDALRKARKADIEYENDGWVHLSPLGKSRKVIGGIGTLKFPPDKEGYRMVSLTMSTNASSGIPALVHPDVWKHHKMKTGLNIGVTKATWRSMPSEWSTRFASTRNIPKACLFIDHPDHVHSDGNESPVRFHPFSIMKYEKDGTENYDFVFANIDSHKPGSRNNVSIFLGEYKYFEGRHGEYLIEPDISNPLIGDGDIVCQSPQELREKMSGSKAYLDLILHRIQDVTYNDQTLDEIKKVMDQHLKEKTIQRYGTNMGLNPATWYIQGATLATNNAQLLDRCVERNLVASLVDEILEEYPTLFKM